MNKQTLKTEIISIIEKGDTATVTDCEGQTEDYIRKSTLINTIINLK